LRRYITDFLSAVALGRGVIENRLSTDVKPTN